MIANRSIPRCTVIPELAYADVVQASDWLCGAFGFTVRLRIANHRVQLTVGDGAVVVRDAGGADPSGGDRWHSVMVRVEDVDGRRRSRRQSAADVSLWGTAIYGRRPRRPRVDVHPVGRRRPRTGAGRPWRCKSTAE
jgi:hypothetical protein